MAGAGGLAVILLAALVAFVLTLGAIAAAGYAIFSKNAPRAYRVGVAVTIGAAVSILLSYPLWAVILSGKGTHGERIDYAEMTPVLFLLALETIALVAGVVGTWLHRARR